MTERRYSGEIEHLRSAERVAGLEVNCVVELSLTGSDPKSLLAAVYSPKPLLLKD